MIDNDQLKGSILKVVQELEVSIEMINKKEVFINNRNSG